MKKTLYPVVIYLFMLSVYSWSQGQNYTEIALWPDGAPGARSDGGEEKINIYEPTGDHLISNIHNPSITPFLADRDKATGIALIIAPGGGHRELWIDHEGYNIASRLRENGISAFVLKYRLAKEENSPYTVDAHSVRDMQRAVRLVRSRADIWHIDPHKTGIIGFSAGGEVAGRTDMTADSGSVNALDPVDKFSSKPDFQVLVYPGHIENIIPTIHSAPAFIVGGYHDDIAKDLPDLYLRFRKVHVAAELHIYANAGHGFGVRPGDSGASSQWLLALIAWLHDVTSASAQ